MLSSVLVGIGCWTRAEGLIWLFPNLTVLAIYSLRRKQWLDPILYLGPVLVFLIPRSVFTNYVIGTKSPYVDSALQGIKQLFTLNIQTAHVWDILRYFYRQIFMKENWLVYRRVLGWGYIWPFFFSVLILYCARIRKYSYLLSVIGLDILVLFSIYYRVASSGWLSRVLGSGFNNSFNRMTLYFFPIILFQTILLISDDVRRCRSKASAGRSQ